MHQVLQRRWVFTVGFIICLLSFYHCTHSTGKGAQVSQSEGKTAVIQTNVGVIEFEFLPELAPNHVENFKKLARSDFYDGTTFHRVIPGFMIQGGDPNSRNADRSVHGTGGPGYTIDAEFSDKDHKRGVVSMARSADPNSAGSQFFIVVDDAPHLNNQYTAFGQVTKGMDVVDQIVSVPRDGRDNPLKPIIVEKVSIQ
jgi:cyclophilin family peptidyl-prolyl cis-trans isomerase